MFLHAHRSLQKDLRRTLEPKAYIPFYIKNKMLWGCGETKWPGLGTVNWGTMPRKYMGRGELMDYQATLVGFLAQVHFGLGQLPV